MKKEIENLINSALNSVGISNAKFSVENPTDLKMGDYSTNVAIKYGAKKEEIFNYINENKPTDVEKVELAGPGFINLYLSKEFYKKSLREIIDKKEDFGKTNLLEGQKLFIEHTQPNLFKKFHIGHLMNNTIGEAVARIAVANGASVKTATYHGDKGLHVAKAVWSILKGSGRVSDAYSEGHRAYEESEEAKKEIEELNIKIYEESDPEVNETYRKVRENDIREFEEIYIRLGSDFDDHFFESDAGVVGKELVLDNVGRVFEESEGAIIYRGEKVGLHTRVFLNSKGLPTYEAKEVGLAKIKSELYEIDQSITITANEQNAFFQVVEAAIGEVSPELKGKLTHLSHGMLRLPSGKMSSRTGDVIPAGMLIEEVKRNVKDDEQVAIAAIKYMILRQAIGNDIIFDFEKSVSTEGDSGVYLQYAHARANSILEKAAQQTTVKSRAFDSGLRVTHNVERLLFRFPEIVERAGAEYAPNYITTYLTELASSFNNFYAHEQVLDDSPESEYRLAIVEAFKTVMKNGLTILGIPAPERM